MEYQKYFAINGGKKLSGEVPVNSSKNGTVALLAASLINQGTTTFHNVPQIEELNRWLEVLESIGVKVEKKERTLKLTPPKKLKLNNINKQAAEKTRSIILFLGALAGRLNSYTIPQTGGCNLGTRSVQPHVYALSELGLKIKQGEGGILVKSENIKSNQKIILYESGDTVTENIIFAASQTSGTNIIKYASGNYMVQEVCFFLEKLGVNIEGIGSTTLKITGKKEFNQDLEYEISEDPIEAMLFISLAFATESELLIKRSPIEFLELELLKLKKMGAKFKIEKEYLARNKRTKLVDLRIFPSKLTALKEKIYGRPYPGLNIDNLPFFVPIASAAQGRTLIHDWAFENRAIYFTELSRLGMKVDLLDPHRVYITGPNKLRGAEMVCPPALRPAVIILVAMLSASGKSILRGIYPILRGYENLEKRLKRLGADIELVDNSCE